MGEPAPESVRSALDVVAKLAESLVIVARGDSGAFPLSEQYLGEKTDAIAQMLAFAQLELRAYKRERQQRGMDDLSRRSRMFPIDGGQR